LSLFLKFSLLDLEILLKIAAIKRMTATPQNII